MSDFENHDIAKQRAQQRAELDAQKKAGVYLTSFSRSVNANLTNDEISAVTNNIIKVSDVKIVPVPFETNGEAGLMYRVTLKASIDTEGIYDYIKRDSKDKVIIVQQNNDLQDAIAKNDALIEDLKTQYKRTSSQAEKDTIRKQMNDADREFLAKQKLKEGLRLYFDKKYTEAISILDEVIQINPDNIEAIHYIGHSYRELNDYDKAIEYYEKAIEINPNNTYSWSFLSSCYSRIKNYDKAIECTRKSLEINTNDKDNWDRLRWLYAISGFKPQTAQEWVMLGDICYNSIGSHTPLHYVTAKDAIPYYHKASELEPTNIDYLLRFVHCCIESKKYREAIKHLENVEVFYPSNVSYWEALGECYKHDWFYDYAVKALSKVIELDSNNEKAYFNRGDSYYCLRQYEKAIKDYDKGIELNPNYARAYYMRGRCYQELGDKKKTKVDFAKAKQLGYKW